MGLHPETVSRYRRRLGICVVEPSVRVPDDVREQARTIRVADSTVKKWFPGRGWTPQQIGRHAHAMSKLGAVLR